MDAESETRPNNAGPTPPPEDNQKVLDTSKVKSLTMTIPVQVPIVNSSNPQVPLSLAVPVPTPVLVSTARLSPVPMNKKVTRTPVEKEPIRASNPHEPHVLKARVPALVPVAATVLAQPNSQRAATPKDTFDASVPAAPPSPTASLGPGCVPNQASSHSVAHNTTAQSPTNTVYPPARGVPFYLPVHPSAVSTATPSALSVRTPDAAPAQDSSAVPAGSPSSGLPPPLHSSSAAINSSSAQRSSAVGPSIWSMVHTEARQPSSLQLVKTPIATVWSPQYKQFTVSETVN